MLPTFEVAHIVRQYGDRFIANKQPLGYHKKVLNAISICRTAQLGGHVDACDKCSHTRISYNSCRNRHCPKCQSTEREKWIIARKEDLLPVAYYHVVFTIPEQLNPQCLQHPKAMYNILFEAAKETLFAFAADKKHLGASMGFIALLHTWGQNLSLHPHLHCIVPGGGFTKSGRWKATRSKGDFLFPIKQMSTVFKNKFMHKYRQWLQVNKMKITNKLRQLLYQKIG
ncbi:MAG: transposase zinc-binding domain-containing protein [Bacteroidetes bacterium]|nr:transposase zinc-binding domain-containing protein [Bacteroidota bacterium]